MIIFHDPRSLISLTLMASLSQAVYSIVDWSNESQKTQYAGATIRSFPSALLTMSDGSLGLVDCEVAGITTYAQLQAVSTQITGGVPTDSRVTPMLFMPVAVPQPPASTASTGSAGTLYWSMPGQGASKEVDITLTGFVAPSVAGVTITFPTPFSSVPKIETNTTGLVINSLTTSTIKVPSGPKVSGSIILVGS